MIFKQYNNYADSEINPLKIIPNEWALRRLKDISIVRYSNVDKKSYENEEKVYLCNYTDVYKNEYITNEIKFMKATASKEAFKKFLIERGDILFTKDSESFDDNANPCFIIEDFDNVVCGYHLGHIKPKRNILNGEFLFRLFQSTNYNYHFAVNSKGITRVGLSWSSANDTKIYLPEIHIQNKIVKYLNNKIKKVDKEIKLLEEKANKFGELKKVLIKETVLRGLSKNIKLIDSEINWINKVPEHWSLKRFKDIFKKKKKRNNTLLKCGSISFGKIIDKKAKIPLETKLSYQEVLSGEFVINPLNLNFDLKSLRTALSSEDVIMSSGYIILQNFNNYNKNYLKWLLHQFDVSHMKTLGVGVRQTLRFDDIAKSCTYIPPLEEQIQIANYLDEKISKIDTIVETIEEKIKLLKEFRKTLINDVVTGKVKVE